jgi:predicted nuclease of predicted toxin-antitoxin system
MAKLHADENFPVQAVEVLRELGHDVLTSLESGQANQSIPDEEVLAFATREARCLVTFNRKHFIRLHLTKPDHTGIIACTVDTDFAALARRIDEALQRQTDMKGKLVRVNRPA